MRFHDIFRVLKDPHVYPGLSTGAKKSGLLEVYEPVGTSVKGIPLSILGS